MATLIPILNLASKVCLALGAYVAWKSKQQAPSSRLQRR